MRAVMAIEPRTLRIEQAPVARTHVAARRDASHAPDSRLTPTIGATVQRISDTDRAERAIALRVRKVVREMLAAEPVEHVAGGGGQLTSGPPPMRSSRARGVCCRCHRSRGMRPYRARRRAVPRS